MAYQQEKNNASDFEGGAGIQRTVSLSPEQFEKLFLTAGAKPTGDARTRFANTAPLGLISFAFCSTTTAMILMGFQGANPLSLVAMTGASYYFGFLGLFIAGVGEFIQGNTFPMVVFVTYAAFWGTFGVLLDPLHLTAATGATAAGGGTAGYESAIGLFLCTWAILATFYTFLGLRTNAVFVAIQVMLVATFSTLAAAYFATAQESTNAAFLFKLGGAFLFVCISFAWYLFFAQMLDILEFNFTLPVGDLHRVMARKRRDRVE